MLAQTMAPGVGGVRRSGLPATGGRPAPHCAPMGHLARCAGRRCMRMERYTCMREQPSPSTSAEVSPQAQAPALPPPSRRAALAATSAALTLAAAWLYMPVAHAKSDAGDWTSPGLATPQDPAAPKFVKTPTGVRYQEIATGSGPEAQPGDTVLFDYVLRRSNGYFIYGTIEGVSFQPRDVPVGPVSFKIGGGELIPGLEEVLLGMAPGGKRRALVPPALGYLSPGAQPQPPTFATKRQLDNHRNEPLMFEVQMLRVRGQK